MTEKGLYVKANQKLFILLRLRVSFADERRDALISRKSDRLYGFVGVTELSTTDCCSSVFSLATVFSERGSV